MKKRRFGEMPDGRTVYLYELSNSYGEKLTVTNFGGKMVNLFLIDRNGQLDDVIMGFDTFDQYMVKNPYFGTLVGRCANRIRNASYQWDDKEYLLDSNIPPHHLHGGELGFDKRLWNAECVVENGQEKLKLSLLSEDGDQGYPGNLWVEVYYSLNDDKELSIEYFARTDDDTVVNLTNHCYYNLAGHDSGTILNHFVWLNSDCITAIDGENIPTGEICEVEGTPFDFRKPTLIGERIRANHEWLKQADGYDINYILNKGKEGNLEKFCTVYEPISGRFMEGFTTSPAVQFYTANNIKGDFTFVGKNGFRYPQYCGLCLETQYYPDSPHHPRFPSVILKKGNEYKENTVFRFSIK